MDPHIYWEKFEKLGDFWYICLVVICIFMGITGLMLNIFVIHFLLWSKTSKTKATSNRYLLINLALSDLLRLIINATLKAVSSSYKQWIFGDMGCQIYGFVGGLTGFLSNSTLALMAIDRYYMIKNPLAIMKNKTESVIIIIIAAWLYSLFWTTIQLFSERGFVLEGMLTSCTFDYLSDDFKSRLIILSILLGGFLLPFVLLVVFYSLLLKWLNVRARTSSRMLLGAEELSSSNFSTSWTISLPSTTIAPSRVDRRNALKIPWAILATSDNLRRKSRAVLDALILRMSSNESRRVKILAKREYQVTKMVIIFTALYCISWMPYTIIIVMAQFGTNIDNYVTPLTVSFSSLFAKSSTILNPLIYTLTIPDCKAHLKYIFRKIRNVFKS